MKKGEKSSKKSSWIVTGVVVFLILFSSIIIARTVNKAAPIPVTKDVIIAVDNLYPNYYVKRNYNPESIPPAWQTELQALSDDDLIGIRCSEQIQDDWGEYYLREPNDHTPTKKIVNVSMLALLKNASATIQSPRKMLTARFCETNNKGILFEYTEGLQDTPHPDRAQDVQTFLTYIKNGDSFKQEQTFFKQSLWPYPGCHQPYLITKDNIVYYGCSVLEEQDSLTHYFTIDLNQGDATEVVTCSTNYSSGTATTCK